MVPGQRFARARSRRSSGYSFAETGVGLWLLFVGIGFPLIILASITYRYVMFYFDCRNSCLRAAKAPTFTQAQATALSIFSQDQQAWNGVTGTETINILIKPLAGGAPTISTTPLTKIDADNNIYFIQAVCNGQINPLVQFGSWMGLSIPGLTGPYPVNVVVEFYAENPDGLTN
jgi:hypothetical protein